MKKKKNKKIKNTDAQIALRMLIASLCFALISVILVTVIKKFPDFANGVYTKWSVTAMHTLSKVFSFVRFSVAEVLIYIISLVFIISLVILINNLVKKKGKLGRLFKYLTSWILTVSIITFLFYALWGGMYYTKGISNYINISEEDIKERSVEELAALNRYLIDKANEQAEKVTRNEQGYYTGYEFNRNASLTARKVSEITGKEEAIPKYVLASNPWSYTQTSGIFIFLTGEANINSNNLAIALPFTCAHELAHRNGITSEDEANFFAFYTLNNSKDINLLYSAYSMALIYTMNSLYSKDAELHKQLTATYSNLLRHDYDRYSEHWDRYEGKISKISSKTNDAYLKAQGQSDGIYSYGQVTDIMLAWFEKEIQ
ncbi:MAG TPA: DUF3810 domain-containing protein [Clostridia bacterium]|nr:MAG: hypothetical protein BWX97_00200 [Firmicutes bacterium ADurb.Bin146]HOD92329.1 DUF3810 domain-containing protein [Clostridia bacterium]HQM38674.1 DUF3810 domain-containing protein [Clostridia bacterium]